MKNIKAVVYLQGKARVAFESITSPGYSKFILTVFIDLIPS